MIYAIRNHAEKILLRIAVRVGEDAIENTHRQCSDIAGRHNHLYALVEGRDMCGLKTTSAGANDTDSIAVNFQTRQQIVHSANSVPDFPPGKIRAHQIRQVAHYRMFRADQIVTTLRLLRIPELAALSLPHRIPSQHDVSPFC